MMIWIDSIVCDESTEGLGWIPQDTVPKSYTTGYGQYILISCESIVNSRRFLNLTRMSYGRWSKGGSTKYASMIQVNSQSFQQLLSSRCNTPTYPK